MYARSDSLYGPWISHCFVDAAIFVVGYDLARELFWVREKWPHVLAKAGAWSHPNSGFGVETSYSSWLDSPESSELRIGSTLES